MNEQELELERRLRGWYRQEIDGGAPTPATLVRDVLAIPRDVPGNERGDGRRHGLTLLAAAALLVVGGGAVLLGIGQQATFPAPSVVRVAPTTAVVPTPAVRASPDVVPSPETSVAPSVVAFDANWRVAGTMSVGRVVPTATLLLDGRVLVTGGMGPGGRALSSAETWDPATRSFTATGTMHVARIGHAAVRLPDGRVLVVGGDNTRDSFSDIETWDPSTGEFTVGARAPDRRRSGLSATALPDGRVLIVGGVDCPPKVITGHANDCLDGDPLSTLVWDPTSGALTPGGKLHLDRDWHTATLLPDGRVLVVGGTGEAADAPESAEVWDPATTTWARVGQPLDYRAGGHTATLLPDGRVLIVGGDTGDLKRNDPWYGPLATAETWDPVTGIFTAAGSMSTIRDDFGAALLPDGRVIVAGGSGARSTDFRDRGLASTEIWDPTTAAFSPGPDLTDGRRGFPLVRLADGSLLVVGGDSQVVKGESVDIVDTAETFGAPEN